MARQRAEQVLSRREERSRPLLAFWEVVAALLLGFAEATFFFLLPETLITFVAMQKRRLRAAMAVAALAAIGGLLGGWLLYSWGAGATARVVTGFLGAMPGVTREMVGEAFNALHLQGAGALFSAPLLEAPYRVHAALAAQAGVPPGLFLAASAAMFLLRFVTSALIAGALAAVWRRLLPSVSPVWLWGAVWMSVYGLWFVSLSE